MDRLAYLPREKLLEISIFQRGKEGTREEEKQSIQVTMLTQQPQSVPMGTLRDKVTFWNCPKLSWDDQPFKRPLISYDLCAYPKKLKEPGRGSCPRVSRSV